MTIANWGKLGNAYYCKHCIDTWKKRNNKAFEDREVTDIQTNTDTLHESIQKIIQKVSEDICDNYCKYRETSDEDCLCDVIRNGNQCPLDRLQ